MEWKILLDSSEYLFTVCVQIMKSMKREAVIASLWLCLLITI